MLDERIGERTPDGIVLRYPTRYATGQMLFPALDPTPTTVNLLRNEYFYCLPPSVPRVSQEIHDELRRLLDEHLSERDKLKKKMASKPAPKKPDNDSNGGDE
ncbi:MAG: hypothetical protein D6712_10600 [Chloroflexi bacterium]|nr:MAG: hypothetical protein D6712_10600 [Chloroflexota bacterium]